MATNDKSINNETFYSSEISNLSEKKYSFKFVLTDECIQNRIIEHIRPIDSNNKLINLQMAYGILEENSNIFFARSSFTNKTDKNTGETSYTTSFIVLDGDKTFEASYSAGKFRDVKIKDLIYDIPEGYDEILQHGFEMYIDIEKHNLFDNEIKKKGNKESTLSINNRLCKPLYKEFDKYEKEIAKYKEQNRKHFQINCEEDARKLFFMCEKNYYGYIKENYDEDTIKAFDQYYHNREIVNKWFAEECIDILKEIISGDRNEIFSKLSYVSSYCSYWLNTDDDIVMKYYLEVCKIIFENDMYNLVKTIHVCFSSYRKSSKPHVAIELLEMTEKYYKEKHAEEFEKGDYSSAPQAFKRICCELRGKIREVSPMDRLEGFKFVTTNEENLRKIVIKYRNEYNDDIAVKECVQYLNCAYGVENDTLFLTSLSEAADSIYNESFDTFKFIAIIKETNEVIDFICKRDYSDGRLKRTFAKNDKLNDSIMLAVELFRNQPARNEFFDKYLKDYPEETIYSWRKNAHKGLLSKFKRTLEKKYKLIKGNTSEKTLKKLLDFCETNMHKYPYNSRNIKKSAELEEIKEWENQNNIILPEDFKNFLTFANGIVFPGGLDEIFGLKKLGESNKYLDDDYFHIGNVIGDGTMICMSKSTGKIYIYDHGKYNEIGNFESLIDWIIVE